MSGCVPTPEVKKIIQAMARAKLREGHTDALDVLNAIHDEIKDHTPLWKDEIADIIREKMPQKPPTPSQMTRLKQELETLYPGKDDGRSEARMKQIEKQIATNQAKLAAGDVMPRKRVKPEYSDAVMKREADLARTRNAIKREFKKTEYNNQNKIIKGLRWTTGTMRFGILTSPGVFSHLIGATMWRVPTSVMLDAIGSVWRHVPGIHRIDNEAMLEGGGFQPKAIAKGFGRVLTKETIQAMKDKALTGMSNRQAMYGKKDAHWEPYEWQEITGRLHDVVKTPLEQYAFGKSEERIDTNTRAKLKREGMSQDDIDKVMVSESMKTANTAMAYADSLDAKLQGENKFVDAIQQNLSKMERSGIGGAVATALVRSQIPILKIPANLFKEGIELQFGLLRAGIRIGQTRTEITGAQADYIMRNLKRGTLGPALMAIGYVGYQSFGGTYREGKKQPNKGIDYNDMNIAGHEVSHHWSHAASTSIMQMGAMLHYITDEDRKKLGKQNANIVSAALQAEWAFVSDLPVVGAAKNINTFASSEKGMQKVGGNMLRQYLEPGLIQWEARREDEGADGKPTKRYPKNMTEELKMGIPGLREDVSKRK